MLDRWKDSLPVLEPLATTSHGWVPLDGLQAHSPVEPRQIFRAGASLPHRRDRDRGHALDHVAGWTIGNDLTLR